MNFVFIIHRLSHYMKKFIVERNIPGAGDLSPEELQAMAQSWSDAIARFGEPYYWIKSYVGIDKIYCVHEAESAEVIMEHARRGGFPANTVAVVANEFGPQSASA